MPLFLLSYIFCTWHEDSINPSYIGVKSSLKSGYILVYFQTGKKAYFDETIPPFTNPLSFSAGASPFLKKKHVTIREVIIEKRNIIWNSRIIMDDGYGIRYKEFGICNSRTNSFQGDLYWSFDCIHASNQ